MLQNPQPGDWLMRRGNYAAWGYSSLAQITAGNVGHLKLAWAGLEQDGLYGMWITATGSNRLINTYLTVIHNTAITLTLGM